MKKKSPASDRSESTYALLIRSEEKERNLTETLVYLLFSVCSVLSIWQAAQQPVFQHIGALTAPASIAQAAAPQIARS